MRTYKHDDLIMALFVTVSLVSNIASSAKIVDWGAAPFGLPLSFDAARCCSRFRISSVMY